ncbi:MAG: proline--tRNA ligase [Chloroflexota bacterium]|nr:proline--tRNA ligase [Chloroflexota bacterium]
MKVSQLFGKTLRQTPAEAENISHQLLLKAGMIQQLASGVYSYMPVCLRAIQKIENIMRDELNAIGAQELQMPVLQPYEMWVDTERNLAFGKTMFTLNDRRERTLVLGPTHEEIITDLVRHNVQSYRDLPLMLYQIQTKFRDEPRPRGGLLRVREFGMKDMYSFDADAESLNSTYSKVIEAYKRIYERCGLQFLIAEADSGAIGGKESHEFMVVADSGEDVIINCPSCNYTANVERAESVKHKNDSSEPLPMEEIATPGMKTIEEVANFLSVPPGKTLKAVLYSCDGAVIYVSIRGDIEVNEVKLKNAIGCHELRLATGEEVAATGLVAGYASPIGLQGIKRVADQSITMGANFVAGANKAGAHVKNVNYPRDFEVDLLIDIATARAGEGCPKCGATLNAVKGIEVGHVFKLGTFFSERMGANFLDREGASHPVIMGCYGIGIGRLLAAAIEQNNDEKGIIWPAPIAPYQAYLCPLSTDNEDVIETADKLYADLSAAGIDVLYDDRVESPGVKLNDADLLGMPIRVVVSPRTLKNTSVEVKLRHEKESTIMPLEGVVEKLRDILLPK